MNDESKISVKTWGCGQSQASVMYSCLLGYGSMLAWILLLLPLKHFWPIIQDHNWIVVLPPLLIFSLWVLHLSSAFYKVTLTKDTLVLSWMHIPLCKMPIDKLCLLCAVGNEREDALCLTTRTVEDMAQLEEKHLLCNYFTKYDVPLIKKKADWQDALAKKYLMRLWRYPFRIFRDQTTLFMPMDTVVQHQIRKLYPQLPYKNYTCITGKQASLYYDKSKVPCLARPLEDFSVDVQEDAIVLYTKKEEKRRYLLRDVKTIVRVDIFWPSNKYFPHHCPLLFLSVHSLLDATQEGAAEERLFQVYQTATKEARRWTVKKDDCCNLPYTPEIVSRLRAMCPDAQWIDISEGWLNNTP